MTMLEDVEKIVLEIGEVEFDNRGFDIKCPLTSVGAQMSAKYVVATQLVDGDVLL
jgi:aconitate decarboxylase